MNKNIFGVLIFLIFNTMFIVAQDAIGNGDIKSITEFRIDFNKRFSIGTTYKKLDNEDPQQFVKRILQDKSSIHHGAFKLTGFRNCIVSFAMYDYQETSIIIGLLLEPTSAKGSYKLLKTVELSSGCGQQPKILSVFLHNADPNTIGKELIIHALDDCGKHGKNNYVFVYNGLISKNKLVLTKHLTELCDYSEIKIDGEWDIDMGDENVEERRYQKCDYSNLKLIKAHFNNTIKNNSIPE